MKNRVNPKYKSEKVNGQKVCAVCTGLSERDSDMMEVGENDMVCSDGCMDTYYSEI